MTDQRPPTERKIPGSIPGVEASIFAMLENLSMYDQHHYMLHCAVQVALPDNRTTLTSRIHAASDTFAMLEDQSRHDQHYYMVHCALWVAWPDNRTALQLPGIHECMPLQAIQSN